MFRPPRCPNADCSEHWSPRPGFYRRNGYFSPKCRAHRVPRFVCRTCGRGFSRQTFRVDYCDHRPDLNAKLFQLLASGVGLRQSSRLLGLSRRCTELKFRKIARHLRGLNENLRGPLPPDSALQLDELESYEGRRNTRPVTVPMLIERKSRYIIEAESAPIRPRGRMSPARLRAIAEDEARYGKREDGSRRAILSVLQKGAALVEEHETVVLETDEKSIYPTLARQVFGADRLVHVQTSSKLPRANWNPLFAINHTEAMVRDLLGRLRRRSWLVSKKREYLDLGLQLVMAYRNYIRPRFNTDDASPAQLLGFVSRRLTFTEALSWRQDWGERSLHPLTRSWESRERWEVKERRAA